MECCPGAWGHAPYICVILSSSKDPIVLPEMVARIQQGLPRSSTGVSLRSAFDRVTLHSE